MWTRSDDVPRETRCRGSGLGGGAVGPGRLEVKEEELKTGEKAHPKRLLFLEEH